MLVSQRKCKNELFVDFHFVVAMNRVDVVDNVVDLVVDLVDVDLDVDLVDVDLEVDLVDVD